MRPALFLDRDGVILVQKHVLARADEVEVIDGSAAGIRRANEAGVPVIVVTNQSGVARGYFDLAALAAVHHAMEKRLAKQRATVDAIYFCPHHPEGKVRAFRRTCRCRKPAPGMLRRAAREHRLDLARSVIVGDRLTDLQAGAAVGAAGVLVRLGHGAREDASQAHCLVTENLEEAISMVLPRLAGTARAAVE